MKTQNNPKILKFQTKNFRDLLVKMRPVILPNRKRLVAKSSGRDWILDNEVTSTKGAGLGSDGEVGQKAIKT